MAPGKDPAAPDRPIVIGMGVVAAVAAAVLAYATVSVVGSGGSDPQSPNLLPERNGDGVQNRERPTLPTKPVVDPVLAGRILDTSGAPIAGVEVIVTAEATAPNPNDSDGAGLVVGAAAHSARTGPDGAYAFAGIPPGLHRVRIEGSFVITAEVRYIEVPSLELDITALRRIEIAGKVTGDAPSDVTVIARGELGEESTLTTTDGEFVLTGLAEGVYRVWAEGGTVASKAAQVTARGPGPWPPVELTLEPAVVITGRLIDATNGVRVAGAVVFTSDDGQAERRGESDANGNYKVGSLISGRWIAQASAPGYVASEQLAFEADRNRTLDLLLSTGGSIRGMALDSEGNPVEGAVIQASSGSQPGARKPAKTTRVTVPSAAPGTQFIPRGELGVLLGPIPFPPPRPLSQTIVAQPVDSPTAAATRAATGSRITDAGGGFELIGLRAGTYRLLASHPDFAGGSANNVVVKLGLPTENVRVVMSRGVRISGLVSDEDAVPIVGATVSARVPDSPMVRAVTGADGRYEMPPLIGPVALEASAPGFSANGRVAPLGRDGAEQSLDFTLVRADKKIAGRLIDDSRRPVSAATVTTKGQSGVSDDNGRFEVAGVAAGEHELTIVHPRFPTHTTKVKQSEDLELVFPVGGGISGLVREQRTGVPLAGVSIEARADKDVFTAMSSETGEFKFVPLRAATWTITCALRGYAKTTAAIKVGAGPTPGEITARDVRIEMPRGSTVAGVVRDENGERVIGATVKVGSRQTTTDIDGRFRMVDVASSGETTIEVTAGDRSGSETLTLDPGDDRSTLDIRIK